MSDGQERPPFENGCLQIWYKKPSKLYVLTPGLYAPFDKLLHIGPKQIFFVRFPKKTLQEYFDVVLFVKAMSKST